MALHPHLLHVDDVKAATHDLGELAATRRRLGDAAGAAQVGISLWEVPPGRRTTPPHVHADEDEVFYVLRGSGTTLHDDRAYPVQAGDAILHRSGAEAHTLKAGPDGLDVLMFAEGSRTRLTYLPRTRQFWAGRRWLPADSTNPFYADAELEPLAWPEPDAERPPSIVRVEDVAEPFVEDREGFRGVDHDLVPDRRARIGLRHVVLQPRQQSVPLHWHTAEEEAFYVLEGTGEALIGDRAEPIRPGSLLVCPPGSGVGHALRSHDEPLVYLAFGTRRPDELCFYPTSGKVNVGGGVIFRPELLDYWDGERPC